MVKHIDVKLFDPTNKRVIRRVRLRAPRGRHFTEIGITQALLDLADIVDRELPGHDYRPVQTGASTYNFVWDGGEKETNESIEQTQAAG